MRNYPTADAAAPVLVLAHGAGAGEDHPWMTGAAQGLADRGVHVVTFNFPYRDAGKSVPDRAPVLEESYRAMWESIVGDVITRAGSKGAPAMFAGGKSMGGRIASQAAARGLFVPAAAGLVFFGYPLHPPAKPDQRRDKHLPTIAAPMLFLHGTRDPFGTPDEMTGLVASLPGATLEIVEGGDHSLIRGKLSGPKGGGLDRVLDVAAAWIKGPSATAIAPL